jgi:RimJ/RimL family protein N-acetyltransferase
MQEQSTVAHASGRPATMPPELRTARLLLRPWRADDAPALLPILEANWEHLGPWIPARVATPVPEPELAERLAGFAAEFTADREWRYGIFDPNGTTILGEVGLYPRSATARAPYAEADRVELGYWLRADATGQGVVTEASRAVLAAAATLPHLSHDEIRSDARNAPSAAIPRRLGFVLESTVRRPSVVPNEPPIALQVWTSPLPPLSGTTPGSRHGT